MTPDDDLIGVLSQFARTMLEDFAIQDILDHLVVRIVDVLPITAAGVTLIAPGLRPRYVAASNEVALSYEQLQSELREGPCLAAYSSGEPIAVPDLHRDDRFGTFSARGRDLGLAAVFTFPLRHGGVSLGALDLYRETPGNLSAEHMAAAQTLADVAAAYLINAQTRADLQEAFAQSHTASLHDPLTGLPNRVLLDERLGHALRRGRRSEARAALFFLDVDGFKDVNDTYDHETGDELLVAVAGRLSELVRPGDTCARLGGDEFVILCEDLAGAEQLGDLKRRLQSVFVAPFKLSHATLTVTASIGLAISGPRRDTPGALIRDADRSMYQDKGHRGPNRTSHHPRAMLPEDEASLLQALPEAIARNQMRLDYQPLVGTVDGRVSGVEALLRWTHPVHGAVPPAALIPVAEQSGQIIALGEWVLEHACADQTRWQRQTGVDVGVSVNVSPQQIVAPGFLAAVTEIATKHLTDPSLLTLEMTESVAVTDERRARATLHTLKGMGITLALDDFGTGYSSMAHLSTLPMDVIKIDQRFVASLTHDSDSEKIITAIIALAHSLRMTVVAEGVETREQHRELAQLGAESCQGFYFARPMPAGEVAAWIQRGSSGLLSPAAHGSWSS